VRKDGSGDELIHRDAMTDSTGNDRRPGGVIIDPANGLFDPF